MTKGNGQIWEALDQLDPALVEDMDARTTAKRRPVPTRVLLAAACIAAVLTVAAVAAEIVGNLDFPWDGLSAVAKDAIHAANEKDTDPSRIARIQTFDTLKELREFLGIPMPQDPYLDEPFVRDPLEVAEEGMTGQTANAFSVVRNEVELQTDPDGGRGAVHCRLSATERERSQILFAESYYTIVKNGPLEEVGNWTIPFDVFIYATWYDDELLTEHGAFDLVAMARELTEEDGLIFREEYTTPANLETVICGIKYPAEGDDDMESITISAVFESGGAYYDHYMTVFYPDEKTTEEAVEILKTILDAYEVPQE